MRIIVTFLLKYTLNAYIRNTYTGAIGIKYDKKHQSKIW